MKKYPNVWTVSTLTAYLPTAQTEILGRWHPKRPLGYPRFRSRLRAAWKVFTGHADALIWPGGQ